MKKPITILLFVLMVGFISSQTLVKLKLPNNCNANITHGSLLVIRGGSWYDYARDCRSAYRGYFSPIDTYFIGFRVVFVP